jgi:glucose 1-dehydrogenase
MVGLGSSDSAIVTGGNSGIGQAIVLELARLGAKIVIDYVVRPEATEALEQQISKLGDQSIGIDADVSQVADLQKLADAAVAKFGRLDIMIKQRGRRDSHLGDRQEGQTDACRSLEPGDRRSQGKRGNRQIFPRLPIGGP